MRAMRVHLGSDMTARSGRLRMLRQLPARGGPASLQERARLQGRGGGRRRARGAPFRWLVIYFGIN